MSEQTWDDLFDQALLKTEANPIPALRGGDVQEKEIEIAYRMAAIYQDGPPTLAAIHSFVIQVNLNVGIKGRPITRFSNLTRLQERLAEAGFRFEGGRVLEAGHA
jgi:hypothetical protein